MIIDNDFNLKHENNSPCEHPAEKRPWYNMRKGCWETEEEHIKTERKEEIIDNITGVMDWILKIIGGILGLCFAFSPLIISVCCAIFFSVPAAYFGLFGLLITIPLTWTIWMAIREALSY